MAKFGEVLFGKESKVKKVSNFNKWQQKFLQPLIYGSLLGVDPSQIPRGKDIAKMLQEGAFDEMAKDLFPKREVYQGQRVAGMTGTQQDILGSLGDFTGRINNPLATAPTDAMNRILARRGLASPGTSQVAGEQGPEVITATEPLIVEPGVSVVDNPNPVTNPLALEQNQVNVDPNTLLEQTNLPGMQSGGDLQPGESAVVGEEGPESLTSATSAATRRALSGDPSSTINRATTNQFIQQGIANPLRKGFQENTLQQIKSAYAGPGYWSSARSKAVQKGAQDVESQIGSMGAQYRYADEQARRGLAESAANRSLAAIPTSLAVQNNPLLRQQMGANISQTQAQTGSIQAQTDRLKELLPGEISQQMANIGLTDAQQDRTYGLIAQDMAQTGKIEAQTEHELRSMGITDAQIDQIKAQTANIDMQTLREPLYYQQEQQRIIGQQLQNLASQMQLAGIEQAQNQDVLNAEFQKFLEGNQIGMDLWNQIMGLFGMETTTAIGMPGTEGIAGSLIGAGGEIGAAAITR